MRGGRPAGDRSWVRIPHTKEMGVQPIHVGLNAVGKKLGGVFFSPFEEDRSAEVLWNVERHYLHVVACPWQKHFLRTCLEAHNFISRLRPQPLMLQNAQFGRDRVAVSALLFRDFRDGNHSQSSEGKAKHGPFCSEAVPGSDCTPGLQYVRGHWPCIMCTHIQPCGHDVRPFP